MCYLLFTVYHTVASVQSCSRSLGGGGGGCWYLLTNVGIAYVALTHPFVSPKVIPPYM